MSNVIIAQPADADDLVSNSDVYLAVLDYIKTKGVTDPVILNGIAGDSKAALEAAAAACTALSTFAPTDTFTHVDLNGDPIVYAVDTTQNPPILAPVVTVSLTTVPIPAPVPPPAPGA
jgi:hypothetical protein